LFIPLRAIPQFYIIPGFSLCLKSGTKINMSCFFFVSKIAFIKDIFHFDFEKLITYCSTSFSNSTPVYLPGQIKIIT